MAGDVAEDVAVGGLVDFVGPGEAEGVVEEALEFAAAFADAGEVIEDERAPGGVCVGGVEVVDVLADDAGVAVGGGDPAGGGEESRLLKFFDGGPAVSAFVVGFSGDAEFVPISEEIFAMLEDEAAGDEGAGGAAGERLGRGIDVDGFGEGAFEWFGLVLVSPECQRLPVGAGWAFDHEGLLIATEEAAVDGATAALGFADGDEEAGVGGFLSRFKGGVGAGVGFVAALLFRLVRDDDWRHLRGEFAHAEGSLEPDVHGAEAHDEGAEVVVVAGEDVGAVEFLEGREEAVGNVAGGFSSVDGVDDVLGAVLGGEADGVEDGFGEAALAGLHDVDFLEGDGDPSIA